jgi:hypothetical protein
MYKILLSILLKIDPSWSPEYFSGQRKLDELKRQTNGVITLAIFYFCQLLVFRLLAEVDNIYFDKFKDIKYDGRLYQIFGTFLGAVLAAIMLWFLRKKNVYFEKKSSILSVLLLFNCVSLVAIAGLLFLYGHDIVEDSKTSYKIFRMLFGVSFAPGIGLVIVWACENVFLHLRTSSVMFIGLLGFLGAFLSSLFGGIVISCLNLKLIDKSVVLYISTVLILLVSFVGFMILLRKKNVLNDASIVHREAGLKSTKTVEFSWPSIMKIIATKTFTNNLKLVIYACFIGLSVQFFTFFVGIYDKLSDKKIVVLTDSKEDNQGKRASMKDTKDTVENVFILQKDISTKMDAKIADDTLPVIVKDVFIFQKDSSTQMNAKIADEYVLPPKLPAQFGMKKYCDSEGDKVKYKIYPSFLSAGRYLGMFLACFLIFKYIINERKSFSYFYRNLQRSIVALLLLQLLVFSLFFIIFTQKWIDVQDPLFALLFSLLIGFFCSVWLLGILHVSENFNLRLRPWITLIAPNIYRTSELILQLRAESVFCRSPEYSYDISIAVLAWGLIFIVISITGAMGLRNGFEKDALFIPNNKSLANAKIRSSIKKTNINRSTVDAFYEEASQLIHVRLKKALKEHYYLSSIFYKNEKEEIIRVPFSTNETACNVYLGIDPNNAKKTNYDIAFQIHYNILKDRDEKVKFLSLSKRTLNEDIKGMIFWYPGKAGRKLESRYAPDGYEIYDLASLKIDKSILLSGLEKFESGDIKGSTEFIRNTLDNIDMSSNLETVKNALVRPLELVSDLNAITRSLMFFKFEAERYDPERYYLYIIKPYTSSPKTVLVLSTVVPLSIKRLEQLRTIIGFSESEWQKSSTKYSEKNIAYKDVLENVSHAQKHIFGSLKGLAGYIRTHPVIVNSSDEYLTNSANQVSFCIDHLALVNRFNLALYRAKNNDETYKPFQDLESDIQETLAKTWIDVDQLIPEIYHEMKNSLDLIKFNDDGHDRNVEQMLQQKIEEYKPMQVKFKGINFGIRIVLNDLIKNALKRTNSKKPDISITKHDSEEEYIEIRIMNNKKLAMRDYEEFNIREKSKKIGIRTVRDILGLPYLIGESEGDPKIDLKMYPPNEEINETLVSLFIPKQYLS